MANQSQNQSLRSEFGRGDMEKELEEEEEEEVGRLEGEVKHMAQKILDYRTTLPDQLKNALTASLAAQRPPIPTHLVDGSEPGPSYNPNPEVRGVSESGEEPPRIDQEIAEKTQLLKQKISNNVSAMPVLLKRMRECISRIDNLESCNGFIHPAFRRKRTS
ncbi:hypothetical protein NMG60_11022875 [Bertholletia excelsa]